MYTPRAVVSIDYLGLLVLAQGQNESVHLSLTQDHTAPRLTTEELPIAMLGLLIAARCTLYHHSEPHIPYISGGWHKYTCNWILRLTTFNHP